MSERGFALLFCCTSVPGYTHLYMSSSHSCSSSPACSFQTFAWNPGALTCLTVNLQQVDSPTPQSSTQVSPGSSPFPLCHEPWISIKRCLENSVRISSSIVCFCFWVFAVSGSSNHNTNSSEEVSRGVAVEKLDSVKKWGINTYKVKWTCLDLFIYVCTMY